jgi:hypothetical protein
MEAKNIYVSSTKRKEWVALFYLYFILMHYSFGVNAMLPW